MKNTSRFLAVLCVAGLSFGVQAGSKNDNSKVEKLKQHSKGVVTEAIDKTLNELNKLNKEHSTSRNIVIATIAKCAGWSVLSTSGMIPALLVLAGLEVAERLTDKSEDANSEDNQDVDNAHEQDQKKQSV